MKTNFLRYLILSIFMMLPASQAWAEDQVDKLPIIETKHLQAGGIYRVSKPLDGLTLLLENGKQIRLRQIDIPDHFRPQPGPIAAKARETIIENFNDISVRTFLPVNTKAITENRLSQTEAHVESTEDMWAQALLISKGLARVIPDPFLPETTKALLELEDTARNEKQGLWAEESYAILTPETVKPSAWQMQIIRGKIKKIATVRNNTYLNFGDDWRKDFTIQIEGNLRREYSNAGIDLLKLQGKEIEVRGYVEEYNGPLIKLESTAHLKVFE